MLACQARRCVCAFGAVALAILTGLGCGATRRHPRPAASGPATTSTAAATPAPAAVRRQPAAIPARRGDRAPAGRDPAARAWAATVTTSWPSAGSTPPIRRSGASSASLPGTRTPSRRSHNPPTTSGSRRSATRPTRSGVARPPARSTRSRRSPQAECAPPGRCRSRCPTRRPSRSAPPRTSSAATGRPGRCARCSPSGRADRSARSHVAPPGSLRRGRRGRLADLHRRGNGRHDRPARNPVDRSGVAPGALVATLPAPLAHAAGAALGSTFYVLGGRGDALAGQRAAIWA